MKIFSICFILALAVSATFAQWNSDPMVNLKVCDTTNRQELVKIAATTDGGCWITWFDTRAGGYAVYAQRLDAGGNRMLSPGGMLISNNAQNSSLVDYDMICDANNNAVITFTDIRNGGSINPFAYLVSPAGSMLWGANGVTLSDSTAAFQPNPRIVATTDGNYIFVWRLGQGPQKIAMQKLNSAGVKQWGSNMVIMSSGTTENYDYPMPIVSDNGSMILMWSGYTGSFIVAANYKIYAQKFAANGSPVWNATQDTVYNLGHVSGFYNPRIFSDGNNGAIFCWRDDRNLTNTATGFLQRTNSAGAFQFPVNGSAVSTAAGNHFDPVAAYMPSTGETYAIFQEANSGQTLWGTYGQRFSSNGTRLWPDAGQPFVPLGNNQQSIMWIFAKDTNIVCSYSDLLFGSANNLIRAFKCSRNAVLSWGGSIITPSGVLSSKVRLNSAINNAGMMMMCWSDNRLDGSGVYAQNINYDGSGITGIQQIHGVAEKFSLEQNYPNPFNPTTKIKFSIPSNSTTGGFVPTRIVVYDILGREAAVLLNSNLNPGNYEITYDASALSSGVYFYKINAGEFSSVKKMELIK